MKSCRAGIVLALWFFLGSVLLPLGDFYLLRDIPKMYQVYTQIDEPEDIGVVDFVVDFCLTAKRSLSIMKMRKGVLIQRLFSFSTSPKA